MKLLLLLTALMLGTLPLQAADQKTASPAATPRVTNVSVDEAERLINEKKVVVLDVRTPEEFAQGHIAGAQNFDFNDDRFAKDVAALDPKTPVLVHCAAGGRSTQSLEFLKDKLVVYHLKDGFKAWEKAGKSVETGKKK